jgi:hypothetical protein
MAGEETSKYDLPALTEMFRGHLADSQPRDLILHTGPAVISSLACAMFSALHGHLNLLLYRVDGPDKGHYVSRQFLFQKRESEHATGEAANVGSAGRD